MESENPHSSDLNPLAVTQDRTKGSKEVITYYLEGNCNEPR